MSTIPIPHASRGPSRPRRGRLRPALRLAAPGLILALALTSSAGCSGDPAPETETTPVSAVTTTATTSAPPATPTTIEPGNGEAGGTTTPQNATLTTVTYSPPYTGTTVPGVPLPPLESNALARELVRTMEASLAIAAAMDEEGAPASDPRAGSVFALRARAQAITARRAILDAQMPLADEAVKQLARLLGEASRTAEGDTATAVARAQEHMGLMAVPSQSTLQAAAALDLVIRALAPLVPEAGGPTQ